MAVSISISCTQNSQSVANNTSNITVKVTAKWTYGSWNATGQCYGSITIDGTKYSYSGIKFNTSASTSGSQVIMTKTVDVKHDSNGEKTLEYSASFYTGVSSGTVKASDSKSLTSIPRASILEKVSGTLGTELNLIVSKKADNTTHTITYDCLGITGTVCTKAKETTIKWNANNGNKLSLASQYPNSTDVPVEFTIITYSGNTQVGIPSRRIMHMAVPASIKPSCTVSAIENTNYKNKYGAFVKGYSKLNISVVPVIAYGSPIASYRVTANGATYTKSSFTTDVLKSFGTLTINATVTDKRGRNSDPASCKVDVIDYVSPTINEISVTRCDSEGNASKSGAYLAVKFSCEITPLNDKNSAIYSIQYKKTTEDEYATEPMSEFSGQYSVSDGVYIIPADVSSSYNIVLTISDDFNSVSKASVGSSISKLWSLLKKAGKIVGISFGKIAEFENVFEIAFQTRFTGGILHPVLEPETDLNDVRTPNTYVGENVSTHNYSNCPISSGTFTLDVVGMGDSGQVRQRLMECKKTDARVFERIYYSDSWGEWVCVSDFAGTLLWSGGYYMTADHVATLSEPISKQRSGIVLVFSEFGDGTAYDQTFHCRFIPKMIVELKSGRGHCVQLNSSTLSYFATKYLYFYDDKITGHDNNGLTGTGVCGITYTNNRFVLRYVIGV